VGRFVLSDAAPLICLAQVGGLPWLKALFGHVHITEQVRDEILTGSNKPGEDALAHAIARRLLRAHHEWRWRDPQFPNLGRGEESCIRAVLNLTRRGHKCLLLIDDREARRLTCALSISVSGTAALMGAAKQRGLVPSAQDTFTTLRQKGFRISESIVQGILEAVGEQAGGRQARANEPFDRPRVRPARPRRSR
jgi:predicted nucleic acid-binding protein